MSGGCWRLYWWLKKRVVTGGYVWGYCKCGCWRSLEVAARCTGGCWRVGAGDCWSLPEVVLMVAGGYVLGYWRLYVLVLETTGGCTGGYKNEWLLQVVFGALGVVRVDAEDHWRLLEVDVVVTKTSGCWRLCLGVLQVVRVGAGDYWRLLEVVLVVAGGCTCGCWRLLEVAGGCTGGSNQRVVAAGYVWGCTCGCWGLLKVARGCTGG